MFGVLHLLKVGNIPCSRPCTSKTDTLVPIQKIKKNGIMGVSSFSDPIGNCCNNKIWVKTEKANSKNHHHHHHHFHDHDQHHHHDRLEAQKGTVDMTANIKHRIACLSYGSR